MSLNVGKALVDDDSCAAILGTAASIAHDWAVLFLAECDAHMTLDHQLDFGSHFCKRFWAGPGSFPFCVVIRNSMTHCLRSINQQGRACRVHLADAKETGISFVFAHAAHGEELFDSLSDIAYLIRTRTRNSNVVLLGDLNVDLLPSCSNDPFSGQPDREDRHQLERMALEQLCEATGVTVHDPAAIVGNPGGPYADHCLAAPITRIPVGDQVGLPSWIDHCASNGCVSESWIDWTHVPADHAAVAARCQSLRLQKAPRQRTTWVVSDFDSAMSYAMSHAPADFQSFSQLHDFITKVQDANTSPSTCAERRRQREPPAIKELRAQARHTTSEQVRRQLQRKVWEGRKHWLRTLKLIRQAQSHERGKPTWRSKKLHNISCMARGPGETAVYDHARWASFVCEKYTEKWMSNDMHCRSLVTDFLNQYEGTGIKIQPTDIVEASLRVKRRRKLDHHGCSPMALQIVATACPDQVSQLFTSVAASRTRMQELVIKGRAFAKVAGTITADKVRVILPLPVTLVVLDVLVADGLNDGINRVAASADPGFLECARKGRQVLDFTFPASLIIEKGMDMHSDACIAQADVKQYYDTMRPLTLCRWMLHKELDPGLVATFIRIHLCTQVEIKVGQASVEIPNRSIGTLTGSRSASAAGRIPLLDAALHRCDFWNTLSFNTHDRQFSLATFVDNLLSSGKSPEAAVAILEDCGQHLSKYWQLKFGEDSKEFLVCRGYRHRIAVNDTWQQKSTLKCLGHFIDDDAGMRSCFDHSRAAMWRCFFGNYSAGLKAASFKAKMRFLSSSVSAIPSFRWSRWPYQQTYKETLDSIQRRMIGILMGWRPSSEESFEQFRQRRHTLSSRLARQHGTWSQNWIGKVRSWGKHVHRNHDAATWSFSLLRFHDDDWIQQQRLLSSAPGESRTKTRAYHGKVHRRWHEAYNKASA